MNTYSNLAYVAAGGAFGSVMRYVVATQVMSKTTLLAAPWGVFPAGTLAVNLIGCLIMGLLAALASSFDWLNHEGKLLLMTGVLGGFTTFSAFGLETFNLLRKNEWLIAGTYISASVLLGLLAVVIGFYLGAALQNAT